jgi:sugar lactone lactonase YvrE
MQRAARFEEIRMAPQPPSTPEILLSGLAFGESPRWHDGRLWFSNWGTQEIIAVDPDGHAEVIVRVPTTLPYCIDWLPDGRLLVVSGQERLVLRLEPGGGLVTHADLTHISDHGFNEIVLDGRGNVYINGGGPMGAAEPGGMVVLVTPDGAVRPVAHGIAFPNGMAITPDNKTLIVADSWARALLAYDIADDGGLSPARTWADLGDGAPDGICIDAEGAVWYADVPNRRCVRVLEGGEVLQEVPFDRGCFACMLGGADGKTLYVVAAEWRGFEHMFDEARTGQLLTVAAPSPKAGWP